MFVFPAFITPTVGVFMPFILAPVALIAFVVWQIKKLNRIDEKLMDIQERLKDK